MEAEGERPVQLRNNMDHTDVLIRGGTKLFVGLVTLDESQSTRHAEEGCSDSGFKYSSQNSPHQTVVGKYFEQVVFSNRSNTSRLSFLKIFTTWFEILVISKSRSAQTVPL